MKLSPTNPHYQKNNNQREVKSVNESHQTDEKKFSLEERDYEYLSNHNDAC